MASRPIVVAVFSTVYVHRQGWSMPAYLFFSVVCLRDLGKNNKKRVYLLLSNFSHSLSESCRMQILRLFSESQRSSIVIFLIWAQEHLEFESGVFAFYFGLFCSCASTSTCALLPLTCMFATFSSTLSLISFLNLMFFVSNSCYYCVTLCVWIVWWLDCTHECLARRSHRNCAALVGSGG